MTQGITNIINGTSLSETIGASNGTLIFGQGGDDFLIGANGGCSWLVGMQGNDYFFARGDVLIDSKSSDNLSQDLIVFEGAYQTNAQIYADSSDLLYINPSFGVVNINYIGGNDYQLTFGNSSAILYDINSVSATGNGYYDIA